MLIRSRLSTKLYALWRQAIALYRRCPPRRVIRDVPFRLRHSVTPFAFLENDQWTVPSQTPSYPFRNPGRWFLHTVVGGLISNNSVAGASLRIASMAGKHRRCVRCAIPRFSLRPICVRFQDFRCVGYAIAGFVPVGVGICAVAVVALKLLEHDMDQVQQSIWDQLF